MCHVTHPRTVRNTLTALTGLLPVLLLAQVAPPLVAVDGEGGAVSGVVHLDDFSVNADRSTAYTAAKEPSISKLNLSLLENPQDIQVVPRSLLDDQGVRLLEEALRNVAGVTTGGYYENWDYFRIRGFAADFNTYVDGLRGGNGMGEETFGLEQVEVVKGPASSLFGSGPLGGLVNLVSKRPRLETFADLKLTYGDNGFRSATLDFNTPLGSPNLLFRLPVLVSTADSFVSTAERQSRFFAPTLAWTLPSQSTLTLFGKYRENHVVQAMPLPASGTILNNPNGRIASDLYDGEPGSNRAYENSGQLGYEFVQPLNDTLTFRQNARYDRFVQGWRDLLYPGYLSANGRTLYRYPYNYWQDWRDFAVDSRLEAHFTAAGVEQEVLFGVDQYRKTASSRWQTIDFSDLSAYTGLDLFHPVYGNGVLKYQPITGSRDTTLNTGYYLHDHLKFSHGVALTVGGRFDEARDSGHSVSAFSPRVGVTWAVRPDSILYANASKSFNPQSSWMTTTAGSPVDPETGTNWELGFKQAAADGRLTATVALFELNRRNVATADLLHPGYYQVTGEQRSRGIEFDGRFSPAPGWELTTAYAYTDARITMDNSLPVGERTNGVPYHSASFWTKYQFQQAPLKGFGIGGGLKYYSAQVGDETHTQYFEIPAYALADIAVYYAHGRFSAQVNVSNALDRTYYSGAYNALYVLPGAPRSVRLTVGWKL